MQIPTSANPYATEAFQGTYVPLDSEGGIVILLLMLACFVIGVVYWRPGRNTIVKK